MTLICIIPLFSPVTECPSTNWGIECQGECNCHDAAFTVCDPVTGCDSCLPGCTGASCNMDIDECVVTPNICGNHSDCANTMGSYTCSCHNGYEEIVYCESKDIIYCITIINLVEGFCILHIGNTMT